MSPQAMVVSRRRGFDGPHAKGGPHVVRCSSMFSQLLKLFPRTEFQALVKRNHAERHARGFTCWGQFVAMLFCQLGRAHSLREICGGLRSAEGKLSHLGITAPSRSTLAYANEHRPWQLYRSVLEALLLRCQPLAQGRRKFRFKHKLVSLDSTVIDLCATLFDWAKFRRTRGRSSCIACWTTMATCRAWWALPTGSGMTCVWPAPCASTRAPSW